MLSQKPQYALNAATSQDEGRALQYFCAAAGPMLSGANESVFWTELVLQFAHLEPAVRHSVVAVSLLHEQMHQSNELGIKIPPPSNELLPLKHYTLAIRELKSMDTIEKQPVVLFVCILFICIELLQSNRVVALQHCKHGLAMLSQVVHRNPWTRRHLIPIFRRLSMLLYLFGDDFPDYSALDEFAQPLCDKFESFGDAQSELDEAFRRTLRLSRRGDTYRVGELRGQAVSEDLLIEQANVNMILDRWRDLFTAYDDQYLARNSPDLAPFDLQTAYVSDVKRKFLWSRYDVCRLWTNMAFARDEISYDDHMDEFKRILQYLKSLDLIPNQRAEDQPRPFRFHFDMAFQPTLFFLVTKCRDFWVRMQALRLIKCLGVPLENLWKAVTTYHLCRRIIELEHGITLSSGGKPLTPVPTELPPDSLRVRDAWTHTSFAQGIRNGRVVLGRSMSFLLPTVDGGFQTLTEFLADETETGDEEMDVSDEFRSLDISPRPIDQ